MGEIADEWLAYADAGSTSPLADRETDEEDVAQPLPIEISVPDRNSKQKKRGRPNAILKEHFAENAVRSVVHVGEEVDDPSTNLATSVRIDSMSGMDHESCSDIIHCCKGSFGDLMMKVADLWLMSQSNEEIECQTQSIADRVISNPNYHLKSGIVLADELGMTFKSVKLRMERLACSYLLWQRFERAQMERVLYEKFTKRSLLMYIDCVSYDETPMVTRVRDNVDIRVVIASTTGEMVGQACIEGDFAMAGVHSQQQDVLTLTSATKAKLLQVKSTYGMLLKHECNYLLLGEHHNPILSMLRNTSGVAAAALEYLEGVSKASEGFNLKVRASCLDKAKSNPITEQIVISRRSRDWSACLLSCGCHILSTCMKKTFESLAGADVAGLIRLSLSISDGKLSTFREALLAELRSREVVCVTGPLSREATAYKRKIMSVLVSRQHQGLARETLLLSGMTGDWRNWKQLEWVVKPNQPKVDKRVIKQLMEKTLLKVFTGRCPSLFPRHRWVGGEDAIGDVLLMQAVHGLLTPTYDRFLHMLGKSKNTHDSDVGAHAEGVIEYELEGLDDLSDQMMHGVDPEQEAHDDIGDDPNTYTAVQSKHRSDTRGWLATSPYPRLLCMKLAIIPLADALVQQFHVTSEDFETNQRGLAALAMMQGVWTIRSRTYPLLVAAAGSIEGTFYEKVKEMLQDEETWNAFSPGDRTLGLQSFCHRLFFRACCCVEELYAKPHKSFPTRLFGLLHDVSQAASIKAIPSCCKDDWTNMLQQKYPDLQGEEFQHVLLSQSCLIKTDISALEAKHATIRRFLVSKSVQTHKLGLETTSCEWLLQHMRKRHLRGTLYSGTKVVKGQVTRGQKGVCPPVSINEMQFVFQV
eukprot:245093-Amphidinium_carterae.1